ncbi:UDP-N-acetylmuramoyl-L-alanyl-D-glutamate--2,6-diaminopimelate ligase [Vagococcus xieshaowenii]|uniref:UDP-N-acetylmuramoyl-L-alanyl-D-glutamate--2,6-diaminopimelate ligase n=1 Tax=Vagococcus xieshaowenii TaxID=2562451 RepID=A0AAJ5EFT6_9ENTE|nr:UDP-N-acetylmuramoyl-L-alanyl-D-glutamate--2,6-diaminopimelate ligase [Vagococcus xieshaowenii]QCA28447.1 UDP-N-acetylmuramoyl-L-alanyl-D-glutamate--2,6-diaminopimelate ligase [Vagococcus xieshaowenii]TFZ42797.1 UDP-N-acetylmuramoyl-L-alanyl-D-glutamate--2,6-diaminopimelate ligase [Vagococcus xieshaowenii]
MKLTQLIEYLVIHETSLTEKQMTEDISFITQDTRKVLKNSLFIAIKGATFDGHSMIEQAVEKGAKAVIVEQVPTNVNLPYILVADTKKAMAQLANAYYGNPSETIKVVGVTGTNGKTTITHLIDQLASSIDKRTGVIGTMYNKVVNKIIPTANTTPDSITLQQLFNEMNEENVDVCAMEVSSHGLIHGRTWGVDFDIAVFTNFTQDHLDFHETMEKYFYAKSLLFSQLGNGYDAKRKLAVINIDSPHGRELMTCTAQNILTYGCSDNANLQAQHITVTSKGTRFDLVYNGTCYPVTTSLIGDFNVYNILAAVGACIGLEYPLEEVIMAITTLKPVKGRFELVDNCKEAVAIVDYAHTPDGLENILQTAQKIATKKIYCVIGCGGDRDKVKRPLMANISLKYADMSIFTSDNPRTEDPIDILNDMCGHLTSDKFIQLVDRQEAIEYALAQAEPGDLVIVAGKGHENYQIMGKEKVYFDDCEMIKGFVNKESL